MKQMQTLGEFDRTIRIALSGAGAGMRNNPVLGVKDYTVNGIQIGDATRIVRVALFAVSLNRVTIEHAVSIGADVIVVHHGWFWSGEYAAVDNTFARHELMALLFKHGIGVIAYHLPIDYSPLGNNVALLRHADVDSISVDVQNDQRPTPHSVPRVVNGCCFGEYTNPKDGQMDTDSPHMRLGDMVYAMETNHQTFITTLQASTRANVSFDFDVNYVGDVYTPIRSLYACSGGGSRYLTDLVRAGNMQSDDFRSVGFITGELLLPQYSLARDMGIPVVWLGHHASEMYGIGNLAIYLSAFSTTGGIDMEFHFYDDECPV